MNRCVHNDAQLETLALCALLGLGSAWSVTAAAEEDKKEEFKLSGIDISGGITTILQGTDGAPENATDLSYSLDLGLEAQVSDHGKAVVALEAGEGLGVDATLHSLSTANYDAFYTNLTSASPDATDVVVASVSQVFYEGEYWDGKIIVSIGKLDIYSMFDENAYANDETEQFLTAMFVRSAGTSYIELDQYYAPGVVLQYAVADSVDLTFIASNGNQDGFQDVFNNMYFVGQINFKPRLAGRDGHYRLYAISDDRKDAYHDINTGKATANTVWGVSFDQAVSDGVGLFARYSTQDDNIAENIVKSAWSLGTLIEGTLWGRNKDTIGIAYGSVILNDKANPAAALGFSNTGDESHIETFYNFGVSEQFALTADVQIINNNGGDASADTVTVAGLRGQLNF
ncbi:MAG: carbohydrate porin [Gammaproteobacteria bacterium]|jgi:hypothetical protein